MSNEVKWIKIDTDILDDEKINYINSLPDRFAIMYCWFGLLCLAGNSNNKGKLTLNDKISYSDEALASIIRVDVKLIKDALKLFIELGMMEIVDGAYWFCNWEKYQNVKSMEEMKKKHAESQKKYRDKKKALAEEKSDITGDVTSDKKNHESDVICSYIFNSNNTNYTNYINYINNTDNNNNNSNNNREYILNNKELNIVLEEWMKYKDSCKPKDKNHYKTERAIETLLTTVVNKCKDVGADAVIKQIDKAMSENWVGMNLSNIKADVTNIDDEKKKTFDVLINKYPKQESADKALAEWLKLLNQGVDRMDMYKAIVLWLNNYEDTHPDDKNYQFVKSFDKWIIEDSRYWLDKVRGIGNASS